MAQNEVLDAALRVYQRKGLTFLRLTALPSVFCLAAFAFVMEYVLPTIGSTKNASDIAVQATEVITRLALAIFVGGPVFLAGLTYATVVVVRLTSDELEGKVTLDREAEEDARRLLPRLFWLNLRELLLSLSGIIVATGFLLLGAFLTLVTPEDTATAGLVSLVGVFGLFIGVIVFLYFISHDALAAPVAVIEAVPAKQASKRSRQLLMQPKDRNPFVQRHGAGYGSLWNLYFLLFIISLAMIGSIEAVYSMLDVPARVSGWFGSSWIKTVVTTAIDLLPFYLTIWTLIPIWAATLTLIYYERRIRLEGYDIEVIAQQIKIDDRASRFNV